MMTDVTYGSQQGATPDRSAHGLFGRIMYRPFWLTVYTFCKVMFRLQVVGREKLPDGPFILSAVHRSFIDTPIVGVITGKRLRFMGKESLWNSKALGAFLTFFGGSRSTEAALIAPRCAPHRTFWLWVNRL